MFFKHLHLYRVHDQQAVASADIYELLLRNESKPLGSIDARRMGWVAPTGRLSNGGLIFYSQGHMLLTALRQERILPASVVKEEVEEQVADIEQREGRKVARKEKTALKEQVTESLLPRAFVKSQRIDLWWDTERNILGINTSSRNRAEDVLDLLRETLGSLKVTPLSTQQLPVRAMTTWLGDPGSRPADMVIGDSVLLKAKGDDGVVRGRQVDLDSDEMQQLLESGKQVAQMDLEIEGQLSFVMHDDLALKSLRFGDALIEQADSMDDGDDALLRFETDFVIMAGCLRDSVARITEWLGGENVSTNASEES